MNPTTLAATLLTNPLAYENFGIKSTCIWSSMALAELLCRLYFHALPLRIEGVYFPDNRANCTNLRSRMPYAPKTDGRDILQSCARITSWT